MAGEYGQINSRLDFQRVLGEALDIVRRYLAVTPNSPVIERIALELDAMKRWTENGREPSEEERGSIDVGLIAIRELDGAPGELADLSIKLCELNNYFEDCPTDAEAASATEDDYLDSE